MENQVASPLAEQAHFLKVLNYIVPYLNLKDVLSCRLTCSICNKHFDDYLTTQRNEKFSNQTVVNKKVGFQRIFKATQVFASAELIPKIYYKSVQQAQAGLTKFSLVSVSISFDAMSGTSGMPFLELQTFASENGAGIKHLTVSLIPIPDFGAAVRNLILVLRNCSNLLTLHLKMEHWDYKIQQGHRESLTPTNFPRLKYLKSIKFDIHGSYQSKLNFAVLQRAIIHRYGKQLFSLELTPFHCFQHYGRIGKLKELTISVSRFEYFENRKRKIITMLKSLSDMQPPLSKLRLNIHDFDSFTYLKIIETAESFAETLTSLYLSAPEKINFPSSMLTMSLPNLQELTLANYTWSLDFITKLPQLTTLTLQYVDIHAMSKDFPRKDGNLQIYSYIGLQPGMYHSNVWEVLPNLSKIIISQGVFEQSEIREQYTRSIYEYFHKYDVREVKTASGSLISKEPLLIWEAIFEDIKDPMDLYAVYISSNDWHRILKPSRSAWLFPLIFKYITPYLLKWNDREIKICREVCSHWQEGVDNFFDLPEGSGATRHRKYWELAAYI